MQTLEVIDEIAERQGGATGLETGIERADEHQLSNETMSNAARSSIIASAPSARASMVLVGGGQACNGLAHKSA